MPGEYGNRVTRREGNVIRIHTCYAVVGGIVAAERKRSHFQVKGLDVEVRFVGLILGLQGRNHPVDPQTLLRITSRLLAIPLN